MRNWATVAHSCSSSVYDDSTVNIVVAVTIMVVVQLYVDVIVGTHTQGVAFCQLTSTGGSDSAPVVHRRVLVADSNSQCLQVFSATTGECLLKFGVRGRQASQLQRPTGVAVTANGNYLVSDYDNKWVGVFSPEGKYINR